MQEKEEKVISNIMNALKLKTINGNVIGSNKKSKKISMYKYLNYKELGVNLFV